jgi:hypothetical protein
VIERLRERLRARLADLETMHALSLERNNPTLHPLIIAVRIDEVKRVLAWISELDSE